MDWRQSIPGCGYKLPDSKLKMPGYEYINLGYVFNIPEQNNYSAAVSTVQFLSHWEFFFLILVDRMSD